MQLKGRPGEFPRLHRGIVEAYGLVAVPLWVRGDAMCRGGRARFACIADQTSAQHYSNVLRWKSSILRQSQTVAVKHSLHIQALREILLAALEVALIAEGQ